MRSIIGPMTGSAAALAWIFDIAAPNGLRSKSDTIVTPAWRACRADWVYIALHRSRMKRFDSRAASRKIALSA